VSESPRPSAWFAHALLLPGVGAPSMPKNIIWSSQGTCD
jgi:hypothetical protein